MNSNWWWPPYPISAIAIFVMPAVLLYCVSSTFIILNWRRMYGTLSRPSLARPIFVFFVFLYAGIILYDRTVSLDHLYGSSMGAFMFSRVHNFSTLVMVIIVYTFPITWPLVPYFIYRAQFSHYKDFAVGNMDMLRRFVNYYL